MLKIAQLSDLHLLADPTENRWGLNPQQGFEQVLALALEHQPDALLLTGDLVHDESDAGYQRLWQQTQATGLPTLAIAGNHDNPAKIRALFSEATLELNGLTVIGLNSHINGSDGGRLGEEELAQAEATIQNAQQPVLIAMHHPPVAVGSRCIE